jgi:hypothetical protein
VSKTALLDRNSFPELSESCGEDEDSFRTPLNHAGIYGLFLVSELAGGRPDALKEWALTWINDLIEERPELPSGENTPETREAFIDAIRAWVLDLIKEAQERGDCLAGGLDQTPLNGAHDVAQATTLTDIFDRSETSDSSAEKDDVGSAISATNTEDSVALKGHDFGPLHTPLGSLPGRGELVSEADGSDEQQAGESDDAVEESGAEMLVVEATTDPLLDATSSDSFAFAPSTESSAVPAASATGEVLDLSASTNDFDLLDTATLADQQVADPLADLGTVDTSALTDTTVTTQTASNFITADDFIV